MRKITLIFFLVITSFCVKAIPTLGLDYSFRSQKEKVLSEEKSLEFNYSFMEGIRAKILGDYKLALKWFNNCLSIDKTSAAVRYELANIYVINKDYTTAMHLLRDALKFNDTNIWYKLLLANVYKQKAMIKQACDLYDNLYEDNTERIDFLMVQAGLYFSIEDWKSSISVYNKIEKIQGISEYISIEKCKIYQSLGKFKLAEKQMSRLIKAFPDKSQYLALLSEIYATNNRDNKVLAVFDKMISLNKDNGFVYFYITEYYKSKLDIVNFKKYLSLAISKDDVETAYKVQYIIQLFTNKDSLNIGKEYLKTLVNDILLKHPSDLSILSLKADILKADGNIVAARDIVKKLVDIDKHNYATWEGLLLLDNQLSDYPSMKLHSDEAIKYFPDEALPYILNGISRMMEDNFEQALIVFSKGEKLVNNNDALLSQFYAYQAECLYNTNHIEESFAFYDKVLKIDPSNVNVLNNYSYYLSLANKDLDKAENMISKCITIEGNNPTYMDTYAWVLFKRKRYSEALFFITRVIELDKSKSSVLMEHYGDILFMNKKEGRALEAWKKAVEYGKGSEFLERKIKEKKIID
jgi:tetratricopeptide (TPR) repeat protein